MAILFRYFAECEKCDRTITTLVRGSHRDGAWIFCSGCNRFRWGPAETRKKPSDELARSYFEALNK